MANKNLKNIILATTAVTTASFAVMGIVAKKKKSSSVYDDKPKEKNPLEGKKVIFVPNEEDAENADGEKGHLEAVGKSEYKGSLYDKYGKRAIDIFLSGMGLIILSPVFAGISIAIKIDDPGPVLFTQKRVGKNKQYFKLHKFRSMKMSTPPDVPTHMLENPDEYITKVGKFLRRHSLDELPQIWDIFIGNMSIIGPRPALWNQDVLTAERDKYGANDIKPGLTGWAQINGRDELEIPDKAKLDGEYVKEESLKMDTKCFLGSIGVFGGDKSVVEGGTGELHKEQNEVKNHTVAEIPTVDIIAEKTIPVSLPDHINVLIAGKGSYIGTTVRDYLLRDPRYSVIELDMLDSSWRDFDFSPFDVVYQVAGIAHQKETVENAHLYYEVNCDLAVEVAEKAKAAGVKHFIYMSSMSVYGLEQSDELIGLDTPTNPTTNYGWSKLQAEQKLKDLEDEDFVISFLRPPMVYGEGAPGNLEKLFKAVRKVHVFPTIRNERSSISVDNLADGVKKVIECGYCGVVILQDNKYRCTTDIVKEQMAKEGVKVRFTSAFNPAVKAIIGKVDVATKAFGNLKYEMSTDASITEDKVKKDPLVSVVMPMYNAEAYLDQSVNSVINQTYTNWELIIVNDCSTDGSLEKAQGFAEKDRRIRILNNEKNSGVAKTRNRGIDEAKGEYIAFLDSDDFWRSDKLELQMNLIKKNDYSFVYGALCFWKDGDGFLDYWRKVPTKADYHYLLKANIIPSSTVIVDATMIKDVKMPLVNHEDYGAWLNVLRKYGITAYGINQPLAAYRVNESVSSNKFRTLKWTWNIYNKTQGFNPIASSFCFTRFELRTIYKYISKNVKGKFDESMFY